MFTLQSTLKARDELSDAETLRSIVQGFEEGTVSEDEFKKRRALMGIYEERSAGSFMVRARVPGGALTLDETRSIASLGSKYGNGRLHITTRGDLQIHGVSLKSLVLVLEGLANAGLSVKGSGGNSVRNITSCPRAGACKLERFDVGPYARALDQTLSNDPESLKLPRKFKVAFSGCSRDCTAARVNDLGFYAQVHNGQRGFSVYAGGGMGAYSRVGELLEEYIPATEVYYVAEAVKRVFNKHGERENRNRARLRFLIKRIGFAEFVSLYREELYALKETSGGDSIDVACLWNVTEEPSAQTAEFENRRSRTEYTVVSIPLFFGDLDATALAEFANIASEQGVKFLHTTHDQGLELRQIPESSLASITSRLRSLVDERAYSNAKIISSVSCCVGAETCRLGICRSKDLATAIVELVSSNEAPSSALAGLRINISGCPNACGRHPIGQIGIHGVATSAEGSASPRYALLFGGRVGERDTVLASGKMLLSESEIPEFLVGFLSRFRLSPQWPDYPAFLSVGNECAVDDKAPGE